MELPNLSDFKYLHIAPRNVPAGEQVTAEVDSVLLSADLMKLNGILLKSLLEVIPMTMQAFEELLPLMELPKEVQSEAYQLIGQAKMIRQQYERMLAPLNVKVEANE